jgi:predicted TIM-barrel fold metal-dependent hydrolase
MITDAQIHLWEADSLARPWPPGVKPDIPEPLTAERFIGMMDQVGVGRAVISPPGVCGFDSRYALECCARYPDRFAITSRWDLDDPANAERLPTWLDQPGMIGIRLALVGANRQRWTQSGQLDAFWSAAEAHDIPLMVFCPADPTPVGRAAQAHPGLKLVVDHVNLVGSRPDTVDTLVDALIALAPHPNIGVKLGALPIRSATRYPFEDLHAPLRRVYDAFGPRRLMWASDQTTTMAQDKASYRENLDLIRVAALGFIPAQEMDWILGGTVSDWFGWPA